MSPNGTREEVDLSVGLERIFGLPTINSSPTLASPKTPPKSSAPPTPPKSSAPPTPPKTSLYNEKECYDNREWEPDHQEPLPLPRALSTRHHKGSRRYITKI